MISEDFDESLNRLYLDPSSVRRSPFIHKNAIVINPKAISEIMIMIEEDFSLPRVFFSLFFDKTWHFYKFYNFYNYFFQKTRLHGLSSIWTRLSRRCLKIRFPSSNLQRTTIKNNTATTFSTFLFRLTSGCFRWITLRYIWRNFFFEIFSVDE